jgi:hypothetical protein
MRLRTSYIIKAYTAKGGQWSRKSANAPSGLSSTNCNAFSKLIVASC